MKVQVSDSIWLDKNGFGEFNQPVIEFLLRSVENFFTDLGVRSKKGVLVVKNDENQPICCKSPYDSNLHIIKLSTGENFWCQWVYQFAHEYCHHLIDGDLSGETKGLMWLEESICHVSSFVCLDNFARLCNKDESLKHNTRNIIGYLRNCLIEDEEQLYEPYLMVVSNPDKRNLIPKSEYINLRQYIVDKTEELISKYKMEYYLHIGKALFPLFYNNPKLWQIVPFLGDMMSWGSVSDLYGYLKTNANADYSASLDELMSCLI
jgi:hypothetical protein